MVRPWITPKEVIEYSDLPDVQKRTESKLEIDIRRAELYIMAYCNNDFSAEEYTSDMPENVLLADMLLTEYYAHNQAIIGKKMSSETYDDYTYEAESQQILVNDLGLDTLLDPYVKEREHGKVTMKLRKL